VRLQSVSPDGLTDAQDAQIGTLMREAYPNTPDPKHRILALGPDDAVIGYLSAYVRTIGIGDRETPIGLIGDVATRIAFRGQGVAKALVAQAHSHFRQEGLLYSMLFAFDPPVYRSSGYEILNDAVTFVDGGGFTRTRALAGTMVCALTDVPWPFGAIDLRGPKV
jgi:predicted N-acetyltransferase YhbS